MGKRGRRHGEDGRRGELDRALRETRLLMAQAYNGFNVVTDSELLDSYIYEIQALRSRYSYLLRQRKKLEEGTSEALPAYRYGQSLPASEPLGNGAVLPVA